MDGEVAEGGALGAGADDFEAGGFGGEVVEEFVLAASSHDVEAAEFFAGDGGDVVEDFCVAGGERVEEKGGEGWGVMGRGVQGGKISAPKLGVDAVRHVAGE